MSVEVDGAPSEHDNLDRPWLCAFTDQLQFD
jgi:hypothetical protein